MFTLLDVLLRRIVRLGSLTLIDASGVPHRYGDGSGAAGGCQAGGSPARASARARSAARAGRGLHERPAQDGRGPHLRSPRVGPEQCAVSPAARLDDEPRCRPLPGAPPDAVQSVRAGATQRGPPLRHQRCDLRSLPGSATGNIRAPISPMAPTSRRRSSPKSGISPPSWRSTAASGCSTSARAGAASAFISPSRSAAT